MGTSSFVRLTRESAVTRRWNSDAFSCRVRDDPGGNQAGTPSMRGENFAARIRDLDQLDSTARASSGETTERIMRTPLSEGKGAMPVRAGVGRSLAPARSECVLLQVLPGARSGM